MGFADFVRGQFIDVIEYVDESNKLLVYKYTRQGDEIKQGASLIVRNGQCAVFVYRGQITDVFGPGSYKLDTHNLPVLSSLKAIPMFMNSPIKSDLYFINTTQFIGNKWGTKNPIPMRDEDFKMVRVRSFGTYSFKVIDPNLFMNEVFGARKLNMTYDILLFLNSFVSEAVAVAIGESHIPVLDLAVSYRSLSDSIKNKVNEKVKNLGLLLTELVIENVSLPEEVEKLIDEQTGIGMASKNMDDFMQYQTARAMRDASKQEGGLAGLGAGLAFGNKIASSVNEGNQSENRIEKLKEYKQLLDDGVITEEEFSEVKKKILKI